MHKDLEKLEELKQLIKKLRAPDGCPWDQQQKKEDVSKYLLEETYEVIDSINKGNNQSLKEELGDLLFQILFMTEICAESNLFSLSDVFDGIIKKMIRRHPHVFDGETVKSVQEVKENWQKIKEKERKNKNIEDHMFSGVPLSFPALKRAQKITTIASAYGFDWSGTQDVINKMKEEIKELSAAIKKRKEDEIEEELGDILFTLVNLSRFLAVDAETALSKTTEKFLRRFSYLAEQLSARGISVKDATLAQMDAFWNEAKAKDKI